MEFLSIPCISLHSDQLKQTYDNWSHQLTVQDKYVQIAIYLLSLEFIPSSKLRFITSKTWTDTNRNRDKEQKKRENLSAIESAKIYRINCNRKLNIMPSIVIMSLKKSPSSDSYFFLDVVCYSGRNCWI